jgi:hypothetical protein
MIGKIAASLILVGCLNFLLTFIYRRGKLSDRWFRLVLIFTGILGVYVSAIIMGVSYNSWFLVVLALIVGPPLGFQAATVIIRIGRLEQAAKQTSVNK